MGAIGVRPEMTRISREAPGNGARVVEATVSSAMFLGDCFQVETKTPDGDSIVAQIAHGLGEFQRGERVHVWWHPSDEMALPQ